MLTRALTVALVVLPFTACKNKDEPVAPAPVVEAPRDAGAPALAEAPEPPLTRSTLSVFEPDGDACAWRRVDPVGDAGVTLGTFAGDCVGARVAWSPDATRAVVWFDPRHVLRVGYASQASSPPGYDEEPVQEGAAPRLFLVTLAPRRVEPLPFPVVTGQTLTEVGLDTEAGPLALLEEPLADDVLQKGSVRSGGKTFDLKGFADGIPELVHARRWDGKAWTPVETKATTTGWDYGLGVRDLEAHARLGPRSVELATSLAQGDSVSRKQQAALWPLAPKGAKEDDGQWIFLGAGGARLYVWEVSGEFAYTTGLLATGTPAAPLPELGFTDGDLVAVRTSGPFVLVTAQGVGAHPRLYELPEARLRYRSDTARAVSFWPTSAAPESHERP